METLKITIDNAQTKDLVVRLLHEIKGVTINRERVTPAPDTAAALKELSGIWAGREVDVTSLRDKAWRRKAT